MMPMLKRTAHPIITGKNVGCVTMQLYSLLVNVIVFCIAYETSFLRF
jgi:hypothetical protein